jgi:hypothetical protein
MRLTSPPSRAECHEIWEPKPPGTLRATPGLLRDCFTFNTIVSTLSLLVTNQPTNLTSLEQLRSDLCTVLILLIAAVWW